MAGAVREAFAQQRRQARGRRVADPRVRCDGKARAELAQPVEELGSVSSKPPTASNHDRRIRMQVVLSAVKPYCSVAGLLSISVSLTGKTQRDTSRAIRRCNDDALGGKILAVPITAKSGRCSAISTNRASISGAPQNASSSINRNRSARACWTPWLRARAAGLTPAITISS